MTDMKMPINADLHCHSKASDGEYTPTEVAQRAANNGVDLWALTDHDTLVGQAEAYQAAQALGMRYITGVEISVTWQASTIHIVGLNIDPSHVALNAGLVEVRSGRTLRAQQIGDKLAKVGIPNAFEAASALAGDPLMISRAHFARYIVSIGMAKDVKSVFKKYMTLGKPGYVSQQWAELHQAIAWINAAGGVAILAHPARYDLSATKLNKLLMQFKDCGGRGIEVSTGSHSQSDTIKFAGIALRHGLLASRGSDFHGDQGYYVDVGRAFALPASVQPVWSVF
jgi:predicted metal-dependent phosphoesterase TrpH